MANQYSICRSPFEIAQIDFRGDVYVCCPPWVNFYTFGNIFEQSFDEIWNGERAKEFRRQFIDGNYNICNLDLCITDCSRKIVPTEIAPKPKTFIFCYDSTCNVKCLFCRSCAVKQDLSIFEENMDRIIYETLGNAENVVISSSGEVFASPHSKKLVKKIAEVYPNIKFSLLSNGLLCNKENLEELGIIDKLEMIIISLHSAKKETYDKLVMGGDFDKVIKNLEFLSSLKQQNKLEVYTLNFVVNAYNYKDMASFVKMANGFNARAQFLELLKWESNKEIFDKINIFDEKHPQYNDFVKELKNPIFRTEGCIMNNHMLNMQPISLLKSLKYKFNTKVFKC